MTTEIILISGFLGAGKTTLIQKMLKETFQNEQVVLIENDFGEISVDAVLMKSSGVEVKEINSGCICCSLSGDFVNSLNEVYEKFHPDKIIIEPSGVSKLSDVISACLDKSIVSFAKIVSKITVIDVKRCQMYLENFGEFYEDQIQHADVVFLNRVENNPEKLKIAKQIVQDLNKHARVLDKPIEKLLANEILLSENHRIELDYTDEEIQDMVKNEPLLKSQFLHAANRNKDSQIENAHNHEHNHEHNHADMNHEHNHEHNHSAEEVFTTLTIRTKRVFQTKELELLISQLEEKEFGDVIRLKGIVQNEEGPVNVQYIPGDLQINKCLPQEYFVCVIGHGLKQEALRKHFSGERVEK